MTTVIQRQRSRRKLAALTFLSNISLDGTHRDTKLSLYNKSLIKKTPDYDKENQSSKSSKTDVATKNDLIGKENIPQEKVNSLGENEKFSTIHYVKKHSFIGSHTVVVDNKPCDISSNESLGTNVTVSGHRPTFSGPISESPGPPNKEVKFMRTRCQSSFKYERAVMLTANKIPFHIFSTIPYNRSKFYGSRNEYSREGGSKRRHTSNARPISLVSDFADPSLILGVDKLDDFMEVSYCQLLVASENYFKKPRRQLSELTDTIDTMERLQHPSVARCFSYDSATHKATSHYIPPTSGERDDLKLSPSINGCPYYPNVLDDPELRAGKHRKLLRFSSYMTSLIDYTKPSELKKELNDKFRKKFPHIQLTLSKLRSLKREILKISRQECNIDLLTVAQAYVYFERLILQTVVNKPNRKLIAGACLILSAKLNDVKGEVLTNLIEKTEATFRLSRKELMTWEFASLVALEFSLHIPSWQINTHYQRLLYES